MRETILVWGTGNGSRLMMERVEKNRDLYDVNILAFVDNRKERWGTLYFGRPVISPEEAVRNYNVILVIASGVYFDEIRQELLCRWRVPDSRIVPYHHYLNDRYAKQRYRQRYGTGAAKIVVYTANMGRYDHLPDPQIVTEEIDYICFTDDPEYQSRIWQVKPPVWEEQGLSQRRMAKKYKFFPHLLFPEYEISIWIDSSAWIKKDLRRYSDRYMKNSDLLCFPHPERDCLYQEGKECVKNRVDSEDTILKQLKRYYEEGYPFHNGLTANGCLVRRHGNPKLIKVMEDWWDEVLKNSTRDQISFPYVCWKNQFSYDICDLDITDNEYFKICSHKTESGAGSR